MRSIDPAYYSSLFGSMQILPSKERECMEAARKVLRGKSRYIQVEARADAPWYVVGITHLMECSCSWNRQILNGQHWNLKTTLWPPGLGPWESWEESAVCGMLRFRKRYPPRWTVGAMGLFLERWNGMGYAMRGKHSPYLWSMSNHGEGVGKFVADGKYSATAVSQQVGAMVLLKLILEAEHERAKQATSGIIMDASMP